MSTPARDPIDECVHCGFCLPACPTYVSDSQEMDSPRGRIYLMKGLRDGTFEWSDAVAAHFDRCLGCMGCVTACPSGVHYDVLIERTRLAREVALPRGAADATFRTLLFVLLPFPARLRVLRFFLWLYVASGLRRVVRALGVLKKWPRLAQLDALAPPVAWGDIARRALAGGPAEGERRARVGVVAGCVQRVYFGSTNEATIRVLRAEGCDAVVPEQGCCGALSLHSGRGDEARQFAKAMIHAFENAGEIDAVVVNAAGCGSAMKEYARLFEDDPAWRDRARAFSAKVRDVTELLASLPPRAARGPVPSRVAYHDACHLAHAQGIRAQPRQLLAAIPGLSVCEIPGADQCCGSAGIYNIVEPERANEIGRRKVDAILSTRPEAIVTANPGCTLHLRALMRARGADLPSFHPVEILDRSIAAAREGPPPDAAHARGSTRAPR
jgi:glycolate oxidase iron-sulfur subunit